jgi:hypothetical protein
MSSATLRAAFSDVKQDKPTLFNWVIAHRPVPGQTTPAQFQKYSAISSLLRTFIFPTETEIVQSEGELTIAGDLKAMLTDAQIAEANAIYQSEGREAMTEYIKGIIPEERGLTEEEKVISSHLCIEFEQAKTHLASIQKPVIEPTKEEIQAYLDYKRKCGTTEDIQAYLDKRRRGQQT